MASSQSPYLSPIPRSTLSEVIVERLINFIVDSGMKPGDKLPSERKLRTQLSVGRSSLREAVKVLEALGIVEVSGGEGMFVSHGDTTFLARPLSWSALMSEASVREVMEARRMIEVELAGLAAERASEEQTAAIGEKLTELRKGMGEERGASWDLEFHLAVASAADNRLLYHVQSTLQHMLRALMTQIDSERHSEYPFAQELTELEAIFDAIRARDTKKARQAMAVHLRGVAERHLVFASGLQPSRLEQSGSMPSLSRLH